MQSYGQAGGHWIIDILLCLHSDKEFSPGCRVRLTHTVQVEVAPAACALENQVSCVHSDQRGPTAASCCSPYTSALVGGLIPVQLQLGASLGEAACHSFLQEAISFFSKWNSYLNAVKGYS